MAKKRVLGVVGMGHVGAHVAYALAIQGIADEFRRLPTRTSRSSQAKCRICATQSRTCPTA